MVSTSCMVGLSKQQTGLRIDRVLFRQFQQLCALEKLRPGEAVESLVRLAVDSGSIADLHSMLLSGEVRDARWMKRSSSHDCRGISGPLIDQTSPDAARSVATRPARPARRGPTSQYALRYSTTSNANRKSPLATTSPIRARPRALLLTPLLPS